MRFTIAGPEAAEKYIFFPVVAGRDNQVQLASALAKTADARGYHDAEVSGGNPLNLAGGWRTTGLRQYHKVGIVIKRYDERCVGTVCEARVFWFPESVTRDNSTLTVLIPKFETLPPFEVTDEFY